MVMSSSHVESGEVNMPPQLVSSPRDLPQPPVSLNATVWAPLTPMAVAVVVAAAASASVARRRAAAAGRQDGDEEQPAEAACEDPGSRHGTSPTQRVAGRTTAIAMPGPEP